MTANVKAINYILCHLKETAKLWSKEIRINEDAIQLSLDRGISVSASMSSRRKTR